MPVKKTSDCIGCTACANVCPKKIINMVPDKEGFLYPNIKLSSCINCDLCIKVCPLFVEQNNIKPIHIWGMRCVNKDLLLKGSSGSIFSLLADFYIRSKGIVFAAGFDIDNNVIHKKCTIISEINDLRRSKYVQSELGTCYKQIKSLLRSKEKVMFIGTPCQVGGLLSYLQRPQPNLICVDFVCHGVPSPAVWREYLTTFEDNLSDINFRDKTSGWPSYSFSYTLRGERHYELASKNPYMKGFLHNLYLRPCCYSCKFKNFSSGSDITLSDFWGVWKIYPKWNDGNGAGVISINTQRGLNIINELNHEDYEKIEVSFEQVYIKYNSSALNTTTLNDKRQIFFDRFQNEPLIPLIEELSRDKVLIRLKNLVFKIKQKLFRTIK